MSEAKNQKRIKRRKTKGSFAVYIKKVLSPIEGIRINTSALNMINGLVVLLAEKIALKAHSLTSQHGKSTVSAKAVIAAFGLVLDDTLSTIAIDAAKKAMDTYSKNTEGNEVFARRENGAGILFSVSVADYFLRLKSSSSFSLNRDAPVASAAGLQAVASFALDAIIEHVKKGSTKTISPRNIVIVFNDNPVLSSLMKENNIVMLHGGVSPFIDSRLTEIPEDVKKKRATQRRKSAQQRKKEAGGKEVKRGHKHLPGKKALTLVKEYQKSTSKVLQAEKFQRTLREITSSFKSNGTSKQRFSKDTPLLIQLYVELIVANLFRAAQNIALNAGKLGVCEEHLSEASKLMNLPEPAKTEFPLTQNGIRHLSYKGGVIRLGESSYSYISRLVMTIVTEIMRAVVVIIEYCGLSTIKPAHVTQAVLDARGDNIL